jgi:hypothetical protein
MSDQARRNRAQFPQTASIVDGLREVFGPGVRLEWAEENGGTIGKRGPDGVVPTIQKRITEK